MQLIQERIRTVQQLAGLSRTRLVMQLIQERIRTVQPLASLLRISKDKLIPLLNLQPIKSRDRFLFRLACPLRPLRAPCRQRTRKGLFRRV